MGRGKSPALITLASLSVRTCGGAVLALGSGLGAGALSQEHWQRTRQPADAANATLSRRSLAVARIRKRTPPGFDIMGTFCASFAYGLTISSRLHRCGRLDRC